MEKLGNFKTLLKKLMKNPEFRSEYEALGPEFDLLSAFIKARRKAKLSQAALAKELKLKQSAVARFESGGYARTSYLNLSRVANKMGYDLQMKLVKRAKKHV